MPNRTEIAPALKVQCIERAAKALFLDNPRAQGRPAESLPADWWAQVPRAIRREYLRDAEVALKAGGCFDAE